MDALTLGHFSLFSFVKSRIVFNEEVAPRGRISDSIFSLFFDWA